ncbi:MAG: hypothetical protein IJ705_05890 [Oscillospiraceae bacterium]|nr:hypothetical protein [Oscillospiraceae bacterium]
MKRLKRALLWCAMLEKRLLLHPAVPALLLLVPLLALGLRGAAGRDRGIVSVALRAGDAFSQGIVEALAAERGVLRCTVCETEDEARNMVSAGKADAAWIFSDRAETELQRHVEGRRAELVTVVEREDNVYLMLAREKLYATLYPALSRTAYARFLMEQTFADGLPDTAFADFYDRKSPERRLVSLAYADGSVDSGEGYLLSPVRGLLAVGVTLAGLAGAALLLEDRRRGALIWLRPGEGAAVSAVALLLSALNPALAAWIALLCAGLFTAAVREELLLGLLTLCSGGLGGLLAQLLRTPERVGATALPLTAAMLAFCPIVLNAAVARPIAMLLPPWWYLHAIHDPAYTLGMVLYAAAVWGLCGLLYWLRQRS